MSSDATPPADGPHPRAIVAGHGEFAAGLVSAVQQITGRGNQLIPGNNVQTLGVEDIEALLRKKMLEADVHVIFTDLQAGSCTMASRRILRGMDDAVLIAGINLRRYLISFSRKERRRRRLLATRPNADARRSPCTGPAHDVGVVPHRRPA
jgi:PTS system N-acetylgalactosamine-specific IIA component